MTHSSLTDAPLPDREGPDGASGSEAGAGEPAKADGEAAKAEGEAPEVDELAGRPDTPVPEHEVLLEAMQWAFQGEEVTPQVLEAYARHARLVLAANREVNLTAIVEPREMAAKHYLDSWRITRQVMVYGKRLLDLGSGAGFPGVPVALAEPDARVTLCDSVGKRTAFLERSVAELGLKNVKVVNERAEDHLARNKYDVVLVRAVSSVRENVRTLRKVRHSLKDLVMLKGPSWSREVRAGEREAERLGFKLDTVWEHKLPGEMGARAILVYRAPGSQGG